MTTKQTISHFPAILIGGPPHAGKSVLSYSLRKRLARDGVAFYLLRAAPDGEGDWFLEAPSDVAQNERRKGAFTPAWVEHMCRDLAYRPLPFLVDVGGRPKPEQEAIFEQCTHAILLVREDESPTLWQTIVERYNLIPLAVLTSRLTGESHIEIERPVLRGVITGLERGRQATGPVFEALLQRVQAIFTYPADELFTIHQSQAPTDLVIDIPTMHRHLFPHRAEIHWQPDDLPQVLAYLPADEPPALYGRGPGWLYAAVAAHLAPQPFYQFDARQGWVAPVAFSAEAQTAADLHIEARTTAAYLHLKFALPDHYLIYAEQLRLSLPPPPAEQGVILDGQLPNWLFTGLTRFYKDAPWTALHAPRLRKAVIVASQSAAGKHAVGQTVKLNRPKDAA